MKSLNRFLIMGLMFSSMVIALFSQHAFAQTTKLIPAHRVIPNLNDTLKTLAGRTSIPVIFPQLIPQPQQQQLYASISSEYLKPDFNKYWIITIGASPECYAKMCTIGTLSARKNDKISKDYTVDIQSGKKQSKEIVKLANSITAYYTPAHAEADFWPASLEWQSNDVTYNLSWNDVDNKNTLKQMADSAINKQ